MSELELNHKIDAFLRRKGVQFPELARAGRHDSRTVKYAEARYTMPRLSFSRNLV